MEVAILLAQQHVVKDANRSCRRWNDRDGLEKLEIDRGSCMMSALVLLTAWIVLACHLVQDGVATGQRFTQNPSQDLDNTLQSIPPLGMSAILIGNNNVNVCLLEINKKLTMLE
ncbi:hypothetical protein X777_05032 [Ooceraea biroi]|uniref:Uncharacterized protein n=1 Tax=Ooceraea biroi TaxID=2015173 RepID=A0A026WFB1_OOCBI|nr:hypothetical protein X777_05032 [Ooceraea biroi]